MRLLQYVAKRLLHLIPVLLGVSVIIFTISHVLPGNPVYLFVGIDTTPEEIEAITKRLGLDKPLHEQYFIWLGNVLRGDLGDSWFTSESVAQDLIRRFPATFELTTVALLAAIALGVPLGVLSAVYRNSWIDNISRGVTLLGVSVPSFWLGLLLIYVLFFLLRIFPPPSGRIGLLISPPDRITGLYLIDSILAGNWKAFSSSAQHLALPVMTQALVTLAPITRLMRSSMLEVLGSEYIQAARANGVPDRQIYFRDALRNALLAPLTFVALVYGNLLGGSVVIERIFAWPGVGRYALESIVVKDYNAVQGFVLLAAVLYVLVFLIVDILYFVIDPRITA